MKHFNNSQQIDYATHYVNSYADRERERERERETLQVFLIYFTDAQMIVVVQSQ
jgi:hypothetical protein